ncbi:MAG TPA: acyltransferase [Acidobacteriaceae bacterium]
MSATAAAITKADEPGDPPQVSSKSSLRYMPGLDVMRGLAILMVLLYHGYADHHMIFVIIGTKTALRLSGWLAMCTMGVPLFFVLSGFLISGILIDSRTDADYFRNFYTRRAVRIVPAYLAMLGVLMFTHSITGRYLIVCLLYFCNMPTLFGVHTQYGPLWSLSVEEQFYLFWPLVVRNLSIRHLAFFSVGIILFTPFLRLGLLYGPTQLHDIYYKTWDVMDFFASGSCMALAARSPRIRPHMSKAVLPLLISGVVMFNLLTSFPAPSNRLLFRILQSISLEPWLLGFSGLILFAHVRPGIASKTIARPLIFLGNISYGLYLCHLFVFELIQRHWPARLTANLGLASFGIVQFVVEASVAIAIAYISRYTFEEFFLRLKPKHHSAPTPAMVLEQNHVN